jgi:Tfp pilus assembly protein PilF
MQPFLKPQQLEPAEVLSAAATAVAFYRQGNALLKLKQFAEALPYYDQALALKPDYAEACSNRGIALQRLARYQDALAGFQQAIALKPDYANAYNNCGLALKDLKRYPEEPACYEKAIALKPDFAEAHNNLGNALQNLKRYPEALQHYEQALALNPGYVSAAWNKALLKLLAGHFEEGYRLYEWRWRKPDFDVPLLGNRPRWQPGQQVERLLIWAEQGVGDHIFFGGLLPEARQFARQLIALVDARLLPLFRRAMPQISFFPSNQTLAEHQFDAHLPMGSLPGYLRNSLTDFTPNRRCYLSADPLRAAELRQQLADPEECLVGITWKSKNPQSGDQRTLDLNAFAGLYVPGLKFLNLQYGDVDAEIADFKTQTGIEVLQCPMVDNMQDLDGLAALISACDLVVSIDNTTVHLAGALGKACWVLLPCLPDWRWLLDRSDSPWYPSLRLYRQQSQTDWHDVLLQVKADLIRLIESSQLTGL